MNRKKTYHLIVCITCGSPNIHCLEWVDANTDDFIGGYEGMTEMSNYCETCEDGRDVWIVTVDKKIRDKVVRVRKAGRSSDWRYKAQEPV